MAETNIGFDASGGVTEAEWATISTYLGSLPIVESESAARVTVGSSSMTVDVAAGATYAYGQRHSITTVVNKTVGAVSLAGAVRWDAIVRRRNWSTNTVTTEIIPGTAAVGAQEVPPTLNNTPGVLHDQLLALVKATNGSTALVVSDKRVWASEYLTVAAKGALPTASATLYGAVAYVVSEGIVYRCVLVSGSPAWVSDSPVITELSGSAVVATAVGWFCDPTHVKRALAGPYWRQIDLEVRRTGAELNAGNADGNFADTPVATFTTEYRPDYSMQVPVIYRSPADKEFPGMARLDPNGVLTILGGMPATNVATSTVPGYVSLKASIFFVRRTI